MKRKNINILLLAVVSSMLVLSAGINFTATAQKSHGSLRVFGKVINNGATPKGLTLTIYPSNIKKDDYKLDKNGNFNVKLALNTVYYLHFAGYMMISKTIKVNTAIPDASQLKCDYEYKFNVRLMGGNESDDSAGKLKEPAAIVVYNNNYKGFDYERQHAKKSHSSTALSMK